MPDRDDTQPDGTPQRKITLRRYADTPYRPPYSSAAAAAASDDEAIVAPRRKWWHIVAALLLVGIMLFEVLLPVIEGIIELTRFVPSNLGEPL